MYIRYNGRLYYTQGWYTGTHDWNHDGEVYTDTVMFCKDSSGSMIMLSKYDKFEHVTREEALPEFMAAFEKEA